MGEGARTKNAASGKQVRRARQLDKEDEILFHAELTALLNQRDFRRYIARYLDECNFFGNAFVNISPQDTAFNLGKQFIAQKMVHEIRMVAPQMWDLLQREAQEDAKESEDLDEESPGPEEEEGA